MIELLYWFTVGIVCYTYLLYPVLIAVLARVRPRRSMAISTPSLPSVSMVISVYNEDGVLGGKFENIRTMQYPEEQIEYLFGSDGSTDRSNEILANAGMKNLRFYPFTARRGKSSVLNDLISNAHGEIVVFSDANTMYEKNTVKYLVRHFTDPSVGAVCGELLLTSDAATSGGIGESSYWRYENSLKNNESKYQTILGATGGIYAIRKALFEPLPTDKVVTDDFLIPLRILRKGFRTVYEPHAVARESSSNSVAGEYRRKVRIGASNYNTIIEIKELLHPRNGFVAFALWSHKIIRWLVPFILCAEYILCTMLAFDSTLLSVAFFIQSIALGLAVLGYAAEKMKIKIGIFGIPYYFLAMNAALFFGFIRFLTGTQPPTWDVAR